MPSNNHNNQRFENLEMSEQDSKNMLVGGCKEVLMDMDKGIFRNFKSSDYMTADYDGNLYSGMPWSRTYKNYHDSYELEALDEPDMFIFHDKRIVVLHCIHSGKNYNLNPDNGMINPKVLFTKVYHDNKITMTYGVQCIGCGRVVVLNMEKLDVLSVENHREFPFRDGHSWNSNLFVKTTLPTAFKLSVTLVHTIKPIKCTFNSLLGVANILNYANHFGYDHKSICFNQDADQKHHDRMNYCTKTLFDIGRDFEQQRLLNMRCYYDIVGGGMCEQTQRNSQYKRIMLDKLVCVSFDAHLKLKVDTFFSSMKTNNSTLSYCDERCACGSSWDLVDCSGCKKLRCMHCLRYNRRTGQDLICDCGIHIKLVQSEAWKMQAITTILVMYNLSLFKRLSHLVHYLKGAFLRVQNVCLGYAVDYALRGKSTGIDTMNQLDDEVNSFMFLEHYYWFKVLKSYILHRVSSVVIVCRKCLLTCALDKLFCPDCKIPLDPRITLKKFSESKLLDDSPRMDGMFTHTVANLKISYHKSLITTNMMQEKLGGVWDKYPEMDMAHLYNDHDDYWYKDLLAGLSGWKRGLTALSYFNRATITIILDLTKIQPPYQVPCPPVKFYHLVVQAYETKESIRFYLGKAFALMGHAVSLVWELAPFGAQVPLYFYQGPTITIRVIQELKPDKLGMIPLIITYVPDHGLPSCATFFPYQPLLDLHKLVSVDEMVDEDGQQDYFAVGNGDSNGLVRVTMIATTESGTIGDFYEIVQQQTFFFKYPRLVDDELIKVLVRQGSATKYISVMFHTSVMTFCALIGMIDGIEYAQFFDGSNMKVFEADFPGDVHDLGLRDGSAVELRQRVRAGGEETFELIEPLVTIQIPEEELIELAGQWLTGKSIAVKKYKFLIILQNFKAVFYHLIVNAQCEDISKMLFSFKEAYTFYHDIMRKRNTESDDYDLLKEMLNLDKSIESERVVLLLAAYAAYMGKLPVLTMLLDGSPSSSSRIGEVKSNGLDKQIEAISDKYEKLQPKSYLKRTDKLIDMTFVQNLLTFFEHETIELSSEKIQSFIDDDLIHEMCNLIPSLYNNYNDFADHVVTAGTGAYLSILRDCNEDFGIKVKIQFITLLLRELRAVSDLDTVRLKVFLEVMFSRVKFHGLEAEALKSWNLLIEKTKPSLLQLNPIEFPDPVKLSDKMLPHMPTTVGFVDRPETRMDVIIRNFRKCFIDKASTVEGKVKTVASKIGVHISDAKERFEQSKKDVESLATKYMPVVHNTLYDIASNFPTKDLVCDTVDDVQQFFGKINGELTIKLDVVISYLKDKGDEFIRVCDEFSPGLTNTEWAAIAIAIVDTITCTVNCIIKLKRAERIKFKVSALAQYVIQLVPTMFKLSGDALIGVLLSNAIKNCFQTFDLVFENDAVLEAGEDSLDVMSILSTTEYSNLMTSFSNVTSNDVKFEGVCNYITHGMSSSVTDSIKKMQSIAIPNGDKENNDKVKQKQYSSRVGALAVLVQHVEGRPVTKVRLNRLLSVSKDLYQTLERKQQPYLASMTEAIYQRILKLEQFDIRALFKEHGVKCIGYIYKRYPVPLAMMTTMMASWLIVGGAVLYKRMKRVEHKVFEAANRKFVVSDPNATIYLMDGERVSNIPLDNIVQKKNGKLYIPYGNRYRIQYMDKNTGNIKRLDVDLTPFSDLTLPEDPIERANEVKYINDQIDVVRKLNPDEAAKLRSDVYEQTKKAIARGVRNQRYRPPKQYESVLCQKCNNTLALCKCKVSELTNNPPTTTITKRVYEDLSAKGICPICRMDMYNRSCKCNILSILETHRRIAESFESNDAARASAVVPTQIQPRRDEVGGLGVVHEDFQPNMGQDQLFETDTLFGKIVDGQLTAECKQQFEMATGQPEFSTNTNSAVVFYDDDSKELGSGVLTTKGILTCYHFADKIRVIQLANQKFKVQAKWDDKDIFRLPNTDLVLLRLGVQGAFGVEVKPSEIRKTPVPKGATVLLIKPMSNGKISISSGVITEDNPKGYHIDPNTGIETNYNCSSTFGHCGSKVLYGNELAGIHNLGGKTNCFIPTWSDDFVNWWSGIKNSPGPCLKGIT